MITEARLTPTERRLLLRLWRGKGYAVPLEVLRRAVKPGQVVSIGLLRQHIHKLRCKIEKDSALPDHIITCHNIGYAFKE